MAAFRQTLSSISIHALLAESDVHYDNYNLHCVISIHALLAESDLQQVARLLCWLISIHALLAESDVTYTAMACRDSEFLSTLSLRRATVIDGVIGTIKKISIHALLAESDSEVCSPRNWSAISIHALLAESDLRSSASCWACCNFYPRSPCGERLL